MLIGRAAESARISDLLAGAWEGHGAAIVVRGEPGIGKSALLAHARRQAAGMQILGAAGVETEAELPFAALSTLLRPLLSRLDELGSMQRAALETALALRPGDARDRFGIGLATLDLLASAGEDRPVLALLDDAHWLDSASADAVLFAARRLTGERVAMLFGAREGDGGHFEAPGVPDLRLRGLDPEDAGTLLDDAYGRRIPASRLRHLTAATGGNPLALLELPSLVAPEQLYAESPGGPPPVGPRIKAAFSSRIAALPEHGERALGLAAVTETGSMAEIAHVLCAFGLDFSALTTAEVAELITIRAGRLEFRHPLLRAVAYGRLSPPDRRVGHLALAEALSGVASRLRRAWHLAAAVVAPDEEIASELEAAAREARRRGAPAAAAAALTAAANLSPSDDERVRRLIDAAHEYRSAGRSDDAVAALDRTSGHTQDPLVLADIEHLRARARMLEASCADTRTRLIAGADRIETLDPSRAAGMLADASLVSVMSGDPREALALARRAQPLAGQAAGGVRLATDHSLGAGLLLCGRADEAVPLLERAEALIEGGDLGAAGYLAVSAAQCRNWHDEHARARELLRRLVERGRRENILTVLPYALAALAEAEFQLGDWNAAHSVAAESLALAEELDQGSELAHSLVRLAQLEAGRGSEAPAREHASRAHELASHLGAGSIEILAGTALGMLELSLGRYDDAIAQLEATGRRASGGGLQEPGVSSWAVDLAEAYVRRRMPEGAHATLDALERRARRVRRCSALAGVARVRGLLAGEEEYRRWFDEALRRHHEVPLPFDVARTQLCFGERLRRSGRDGEAREMLRAALSTFEGLGAAIWAERARAELATSGELSRPRFARATELTPQELQVAMHVIEGASNREVAATLFISPKTVEVHLTRIYRKLGVRSRTQLARALRPEPGETP